MRFFYTKHHFLLIIILLSFCKDLLAQDFEVAPVLVKFDANPGEIQTQTLTIRNHSNERQKFALNLADYIVDEKGTKKSIEPGTTNRSLFNWLNINPSFVELNPNESAEVSLILAVPQTGFNTRWGMIQVEVAKEQSPSSADKQLATGVIVVPRIVVLVKQSPRSNQNFSAKVSNLHEVTEKDDEFRSFEASIANTGDQIIDAKVFLALANIETAEEKQFKPTTFTVYPDQVRNVILTLPEKINAGNFAIAILMDYGNRAPIEGAQILLEVK